MKPTTVVRLREQPGVKVAPGLTRIVLPYARPPLNANDRDHWATKRRTVAQLRLDVRLLAANLAPLQGTCEIGLMWIVPDSRRRDADNIAPTLKPCIDGLRDAGVLIDDDSTRVTQTWQRIEKRDGYGLEVHIEQGVTA